MNDDPEELERSVRGARRVAWVVAGILVVVALLVVALFLYSVLVAA